MTETIELMAAPARCEEGGSSPRAMPGKYRQLFDARHLSETVPGMTLYKRAIETRATIRRRGQRTTKTAFPSET